jgi:hypothetical protein
MTVAIASVSCKKEIIGEGPVTTRSRTISNFTGIDLRMNGIVNYSNAATWKVEITAKESIHSMLETNVNDGKLIIRYSNGKTYDADESIRINVSGPAINSLITRSTGSLHCLNAMETPSLFLASYGSGSIYLQNVEVNSIDAESTVSGRITATGGTAGSEKIKTDGSAKVDFSSIAAQNVTARSIGSGDIKIKVAHYLDATIDGSGSIYFSGYPLLTTHINGSGELIRF